MIPVPSEMKKTVLFGIGEILTLGWLSCDLKSNSLKGFFAFLKLMKITINTAIVVVNITVGRISDADIKVNYDRFD